MKYIFILALLTLSINAFTQANEAKKRKSSEIINELSYFWKLDSLGTNGLRLYTYELILKSSFDTLTLNALEDKLGKPNKILTSQKDVQYIYFYLDPRSLGTTEYGSLGAIYYIGFLCNKNEKVISKITTWHLDL